MKDAPREILLLLLDAALEAVAPDRALVRNLRIENNKILAGGGQWQIPGQGIRVLGAGKGAAPMAAALENLLGGHIKRGFTVVKYGHGLKLDRIEIAEAGHPVPDAAGEKAAGKFLEIAGQCGDGDLLLCLFTGGASALLPAPAPGLDLAALGEATSLLLGCGADIGEINAIRKHLSRLSGGRLAKAANGANVLSLIVSDVIGDDLQTIASGPTAPDPYTYVQCLELLEKYQLNEKFPPQAMRILIAGANGELAETPKKEDAFFKKVFNIIVASNGQALEAAAKKALELGLAVEFEPEPMAGDAAAMAEKIVAKALSLQKGLKPGGRDICLLAGGETTVVLKGHGQGGRNQEMALAASLALEGRDGIYALFAGTDGTDGPTDAAGGFADPDSVARMGGREEALNYLGENDSYKALKKAGAHLVTGPTRTNVMDVAIILVQAQRR